jgi:uncharacterized protein YkwD
MRPFTLVTSLAAAGVLALPAELEKRQAVTVVETVTVTTTVFGNPYTTPAWRGPPKFQGGPERGGPDGDPPKWTPPRIGQGRPTVALTRDRRLHPSQASSAIPAFSQAASVAPEMTSSSCAVSSDTVSSASPSATDAFSSIVASASPTDVVSSSTIVVGNPVSNTPVPSSDIPVPTGGAAPLDPGHISGTTQTGLTPADGEDYINAILFHHNQARANHGAEPLVWNATVADTAAITANTCEFAHYIPDGAGQGQNLFTTSGPVFNVTAGITES